MSKFALACMANQLAGALAAAGTVTDHGLKIPLLKATRIEVGGGSASIIATNTDQSIHKRIAAEGSGVVHLDTAALTAKITALKQTAPVAIEGDGKAVTITQGRTRWKLPVLANTSVYDFVTSAAAIEGAEITLPGERLRFALAGVRTSASTDASRYYLAGPYVDFGDGLRLVATDGNTLAVIQVPGEFARHDGFIVPMKAVDAIARLFDPETPLTMIFNDQTFTLGDGETLFRSKMIEGVYPDWRRVVPSSEGAVYVDGAEFVAAIERVSAIRENVGTASKFVPVTMIFRETEIELTTQNGDGEEGSDYCACERIVGEADYHVVISADMITSALRSFGAVDTVRIGYGSTKARRPNDPPPTMMLSRAAAEGDDFRLASILIDSKGAL